MLAYSVIGVRQKKASADGWQRRLSCDSLLWRRDLSEDSFAYCLRSRNQTCAEQEESGGLGGHLDLASDLTAGEVGVVNVGVGVSAVQRSDQAGFC